MIATLGLGCLKMIVLGIKQGVNMKDLLVFGGLFFVTWAGWVQNIVLSKFNSMKVGQTWGLLGCC